MIPDTNDCECRVSAGNLLTSKKKLDIRELTDIWRFGGRRSSQILGYMLCCMARARVWVRTSALPFISSSLSLSHLYDKMEIITGPSS